MNYISCLSNYYNHFCYRSYRTPMSNDASALTLTLCRLRTVELPVGPSTMEKVMSRDWVVRGMAEELKEKEMVRLSCKRESWEQHM